MHKGLFAQGCITTQIGEALWSSVSQSQGCFSSKHIDTCFFVIRILLHANDLSNDVLFYFF